MATTEEILASIDENIGRLADAAERIAAALEPAENEDAPMTIADNLQAVANCVSTEGGEGLCEAIVKAAKIIAAAAPKKGE